MTQIKKTLGIAGIIAMVGAPAMADIASTDYVQNIVNNIPKPAAATASSAGLTKLYTGVGTNTDGAMTQKAITDALDAKLNDYDVVLGKGASTEGNVEASIAIGSYAKATNSSLSTAIGYGAVVSGASQAIQLGQGTNTTSNSFGVSIACDDELCPSFTLLKGYEGVIPAARLTGGEYTWDDGVHQFVEDNGVSGQLLQTNGDGTMSWVNAPSVPEGVLSNNTTEEGAIAIGENSTVTDLYGVAIGKNTTANMYALAAGYGAEATADGSVALGENAQASGGWSVSLNGNAKGQSSIAIGSATANGSDSIAMGTEAITGSNSIQLGTGNNYNANTFQVWNTTLLNADGIVPATALATEIPDDCKVDGQECALVAKWNSAQNKFTQSWEVVKVSE